jgi:hypothetical protein
LHSSVEVRLWPRQNFADRIYSFIQANNLSNNMARNEEKSHSMLNRWVTMKREQDGKGPKKAKKRPYLSSMVNTLGEAEHWRTDLLKEISKNVMIIQNGSLCSLLLLPLCLALVGTCPSSTCHSS